jgi:murein DD-endopeptidase MepM/ murein hydrolase activator NlpD
VARWPSRSIKTIMLAMLLAAALPAARARAAPPAPVEADVQAWLDQQPGRLKSYRDGQRSAAQIIDGAGSYYGLSPRVLLALMEATNQLLSDPSAPDSALRRPFGSPGPDGFAAQVDWATRELRAGFGPYDRPPTVLFTDGTSLTLTLQQAPEGVAVQRFLARGRDQADWRATVDRFGAAFQRYFDNQIPDERSPQPVARAGFLQRPWRAGTHVSHLAYFDHIYPTVDTGRRDDGTVVNYLGRSGMQYDGHDGHDFYFPDQPIGTYIKAAAAGMAHASTHRGNGVWIEHPNGYVTVYWHLDRFASIFRGKVNTGAGVPVKAGDLIGSSGRSGFVGGTPHLHFEVRHNGREVDPYGWFGPGDDPCAKYAACEGSTWLWSADLVGEFDFTPPERGAGSLAAGLDRASPSATLTVEPRSDLLLLARFDGSLVQQVGTGSPTSDGAPAYDSAKFDRGVRVPAGGGVSYPTAGNLRLDAGTIAFWASLPDRYPSNSTGRSYLLAASAHPDQGPTYSGTLALRRDMLGPGGAARWDFWTTPENGTTGRDDLAVPDTLAPGPHHFAITWDRAAGRKALFLDGALVATVSGITLPSDVGAALTIGRWGPGAGASGATFDELAIFGRAFDAAEVADLAAAMTPLPASAARVSDPTLRLDANAADASGIVSVQIGVNGLFGDPQPYEDGYRLTLPAALGVYTIAARFVDRAGNSAVVSATVELAQPPAPTVHLEDLTTLNATLVFSDTAAHMDVEVQVAATPDFADASWRSLPRRLRWAWSLGASRIVWVRFRDRNGLISAPLAVGPGARRVYLPLTSQRSN